MLTEKKLMKFWHVGTLCISLVLISGCSDNPLSNKRIDYRTAAVQVPVLEVPPDLTAPGRDDRYKMPQGDGESVATFSDYSKSGGGTFQGRVADAVLPEIKNVRLERNGAQRWLVVGSKPENVWSIVKTFIQENGLAIKSEDQVAGIMETDWAENRAKIPQDGIRSIIEKVFDNAYSSGERDRYRVRLERSKDGASTEVYFTHYGMEEMPNADKSSFKWQARPNDPEMEAIILQRLMVRFGGSEARSTPSAPVLAGAVALQDNFDGSRTIIVVSDTFDKSWRRIGLAIERAGLFLEDKDRAKGIYFLRTPKAESGLLSKMQFWKDNKNSTIRYRVNIKDGGTACEASVTDQNGVSDDSSKQILEAIYTSMNQ
jgi:outer membrane protein assembly factor BamC